MIIKLILLVPLSALALLFLFRIKDKTFYRLFLMAVAMLGIFFVLKPDVTTRLANLVGVGRGTDLILYLCVVSFFFAFMLVYSKLRRLEAAQTAIIREIALSNAKKNV